MFKDKEADSKEEVWNIKVSIGQIIELANKLNIKYSAHDRILPNLEMSLIDFQSEMNQSFSLDHKMQELELYLNQLLQTDTLIFSLAVRTFFKFNFLKVSKPKGTEGYKSTTGFDDKPLVTTGD